MRWKAIKVIYAFVFNSSTDSAYFSDFQNSFFVTAACPRQNRCGTVAYRLDLPTQLSGVHNVFHISQLKKHLKPPLDVVIPEIEQLQEDLTYPEHPIGIVDQKDRITRNKTTKFYKV